MNPEAIALWDKIRNPTCTDCALFREAQTVCLIGDGPVPARYMIIGEAPGYREDEIGKPFSGKSGQLLDEVLEGVGLSREAAFISNVAKCRPPENRAPTRTEQKACRPYLDAEIEAVQPEFVLLLGNTALQGFLKKSGIMKHRGEVYPYGEAKVFATVHPAAVLRNPRYDHIFKTDLATFARMVKGEEGAKPTKTYLVRDKKSLITLCKAIMLSEAVAYDLETNDVEEFNPDTKIVTIGVSPTPGVAFVVPIEHPETPWKDPYRVLKIIGNALMYSNGKRIAHNAKFDDRWLTHFGIPIRADFDTMIAAHVLDENRFKGLKPLAQMLLGVDPWKDVDLSGGGALTTPISQLARYNAKDADYTLRLYYRFREELTQPGNERTLRLFYKLLMPVSRALTDVERTGMWIDKERLAIRRIEVQKKLTEINNRLVELVGHEANWNSPIQLAKILFEELGLQMYDLTAKGSPSTKESVLLRLKDEHEVPRLILEYREWSKYKSSYFDNWVELMDQHDRIHTHYRITGTVTGRLSSGKEHEKARGINVQQIPRNSFVRGVVGAPPGWRFVEADFSQVELRVAAHYSGDREMQRLFQLGQDIHLATAMQVTGKPASEIDKETRKKAKAVNFGFLFGMGWRKFIEYARDNYGVVVTEDEAQLVQKRFFDTFKGLRPWHERQRRLVRKYGRVQSLIGRVRHLPDIRSGDEEVRKEAERQAINSPVQSLASDLMLLSLVILHNEMDPSEAKIVGTVHDSILFEIVEDEVDTWVARIRKTMENLPLKQKFGVELSVPIRVDIKVGQHWSEGEEV